MLTSDTKRRIDACRDILVGKLPLPTDQVELITLALIYKFMDDLDEESVAMGGQRSFFTGALAPYRWRALMRQTLSADERMTLFADGLEFLGGGKKLRLPKKNGRQGEEEETDIAAHLPPLFRDIFKNAFLKFRDGRTLSLFLTELGGFAYSHSEELGNAFEYILQCMGAQGDNGQFRTPRHIIDFIVACLDPQPTDRILDPACGTGGFLVSAFKHILRAHTSPDSTLPGDRLGHEQRQRLYGHFTGYDINDQMVKLSRVNLFLHQFATPTIHIYDSLSNDARWDEKYDLILANPPFMTPKGGVVPHTRFRIPAKKAEVLFTDYIAEHLTPDGRAGIIVPNGIVATTQNAYVTLRRFLVEDSLVAVVSLPAGCFKPYSGVKTSILFLDKKLARRTDKVLFLKIAADGFDLGDQRREISANDLPLATRYLDRWFRGELGENPPAEIPFKRVDRRELLAHLAVSLQAEQFLGETIIASESKSVRLGDICEKCRQINPATLSRATFRYIDIDSIDNTALRITDPKLTATGEAPSRARKQVHSGDVLFSTVRPYLRNIALVPSHLDGEIASTGLAVIRADTSKALPAYLFAVVSQQSFVDSANALTSGASYPAITENQLLDLEIPLPPLEEQERIVAEIEGYQQVIDGARQILASYRPRFESKPAWGIVALGEVCETTSGGTPLKSKREYYEGGTIPWLKSGEVAQGFVRQVEECITEAGLKNSSAKLFPAETVLVAMYGATAGQVGLLKISSTTNQAVCGILPNEKFVPEFLFYHLKARTEEMKALAGGGAQPNISQQIIRSLQIPLPPLPEQERIVAELEAEAARIEAVRGLIPLYEAKIQRVLARV